jgi:hypothetical protein
MNATQSNGFDSFVAATSGGIAANVRVKLNSSNKIELAGASDIAIGVTMTKSTDGVTPVGVKLKNAPGSFEVVASGAFAAGVVVKSAADGKVVSGGAGHDFGIAFGSSTAANDVVVVYPL